LRMLRAYSGGNRWARQSLFMPARAVICASIQSGANYMFTFDVQPGILNYPVTCVYEYTSAAKERTSAPLKRGCIMGWNFVPEIVAICILTIILIFHHKTIYVRTRRDTLFVRCIWTSITASFINTLSVIAILNARVLPLLLNIIINDLFFLVTPFILVTFAEYWLYIIYEDSPQAAYYRFARIYMYVFAGIIALMTIANHSRRCCTLSMRIWIIYADQPRRCRCILR
jgi:hypothetical protein